MNITEPEPYETLTGFCSSISDIAMKASLLLSLMLGLLSVLVTAQHAPLGSCL